MKYLVAFLLLLTIVSSGPLACLGCCSLVCGGFPLCIISCEVSAGVVCPAPPICMPVCFGPLP
jgi:hypothetical protein